MRRPGTSACVNSDSGLAALRLQIPAILHPQPPGGRCAERKEAVHSGGVRLTSRPRLCAQAHVHSARAVRRPSAGLARSRRTRRRVFATSTTSPHTAWRRRMRRLTGRCRGPSSGELSCPHLRAIDEPSAPCRHWYDAGIGPGQYGVHTTDTTWPIITQHVGVMEALFASAPAICPA